MPKIFEYRGYRFFFFSNEGEPLERRHVHVRKGANIAKFWIEPEVACEAAWGMSANELNNLEKIVEEHKELIRRKWDEYFS
jgi:hypothetical protein